MAASGVVCRSSRVLVIDMNRAFNLACFVAAGPCNKGLSQNQPASPFSSQIPKLQACWARRLHHCRRLSTLDKSKAAGGGLLASDAPAPDPPTAASTSTSASTSTTGGGGGEVTVEYYRGLPQVTVPLPSRRERCRFTLRPVSNTVGDFLAMLRHEDHGIDRVAVSSLDDVRIASSNTIEVLMENDFKLIVNDSVYVVNTPRQERLTKEELQRLSDVRNLVNQMYEALNVEEHQLHKERQLCSQLEELKVELEPMEQKRQELEQVALRRTNMLTWVGLGLMSVQFGILARLTWWEYSWDIMEPVTYFVTYGTAMAAYAYFVLTRQEYLLPDVKDRQHLIILHKRARKVGLDLGRYNQLKDSVAQLEADLRRLRDPLQLHLPPHHLSTARPGAGADASEPRSPLERAQAHIRSLLRRGKSST